MSRKIIYLFLLVFYCLNFTFCSDDKVDPIFLNVQSSIVFASSEDSKRISVLTNAVSWSFSVDQEDWVTVSKYSENEQGGLNISVTKNNNQDSRSTVIRVTTGDIKKDIKIEQLGNDNKIIIS